MKPYKSLFSESGGSLEVSSEREAKQIVDISNLEWGDYLTDGRKFFWFGEAQEFASQLPGNWRIPTIQELYTAYIKRLPYFEWNRGYWSSSFKNKYEGWYCFFSNGFIGSNPSLSPITPGLEGSEGRRRYQICPVREI